MRLVGASNFTIKMPFVIEGMVLGIIGSIIPIIIVIYGYFTLYNHFDGQLYSPLIKLITPEPFIYIVSLIIFKHTSLDIIGISFIFFLSFQFFEHLILVFLLRCFFLF